MQKTALSIVASTVLLAVFASPALGAPTVSFTVNPDPAVSGVPATYTSTSTADAGFQVAEVDWDFDNDGDYEVKDTTAPFTTTHTYAVSGTRTFGMKVIDNNALVPMSTTATKTVTVVTRPPTADFSFSPSSPFVGDDVLFAPDASDPDGDALKYSWDFGDGSDGSTAHTPVHNFASAGTYQVSLTVSDGHGGSTPISHEVVVRGVLVPGNALPVGRFAFSPRTATVGDPVEFVSSSYDRDGQVKDQAWDFNGDGQFDDGHGDDVIHTFTEPGSKTVRLRVTDSAGSSVVAARALVVKAAPKPRPGFLRPSPHVYFSGLIFSRGMRMQTLGASGPRGALVTVRCSGKGCPAKQRRKRIKHGAVRFRNFERFLRHGIQLQFFVTKPNTIGTYRSYKIRAGKAPITRDGCVLGTRLKRSRCPS